MWAQGTPYQKPKVLGFGPLFFGEPENFIFVFFAILLFHFSISVRRGVRSPPLAAGRINSKEIHYGMVPVLNSPYWKSIQKKADVDSSPYTVRLLGALLKR